MKKIKCKFKGHKLVKIETQNVQLKEYKCSHCQQQFTTDGYGRIVKLNEFWKENHRLFENYFKQRAAI